MKLVQADIQNFRSIRSTTVSDIGGFNVIIGKNNAGKSTVLLAISAFFRCLKFGIVSTSPQLGGSLDYHASNISSPLSITLTFRLNGRDVEDLAQEIESVAPQMRNALDRLSGEMLLAVSVVVSHGPPPIALVRSVTIRRPNVQDPTRDQFTVLKLDDDSAQELARKVGAVERLRDDSEAVRKHIASLRHYQGELWERIRADARATRNAIPRYSREEHSLSPAARERLESLVASADSYNAIKQAADELAGEFEREAAETLAAPLKSRVETFAGHDAQVPAYATSLLRRIGSLKVLYLTERREQIGRDEAAQLLDLKVTRGGTEKLRSIQSTVSALLGVEIDAFRSDVRGRRPESPAELDVDNFLVQVNGAGIREALRLIIDYEFKRPDILLVEEPEIHLHPALETSMMHYLKEIGNESQIFITTHSTNFLDTADMRNVYLARREDGCTSVQKVDHQEAESVLPSELGIRLSSLFMYDRLVFVEGLVDEAVLHEWATKLDVRFAARSVGFVRMGGVRNLAHFAAEGTVSFLARRRVKLWFVIDRDENTGDDIAKLKAALAGGGQLVVLPAREIENLLLDPQAIAQYIAHRLEAEGGAVAAPTVDQVAAAIDDTADSLRELTIAYHCAKVVCSPIYADRRAIFESGNGAVALERIRDDVARRAQLVEDCAAGLTSTIDGVRASLDGRWQSERRELVPGALLLEELFKRFGLGFRKERDSARIASYMFASSIPREISQFLREVAI